MCCRFHLQEQSAGELDQNGTKLGVSPWLGLGATQERIQPIPRKENVTVRRPETVGWLSRGYVHVRRTRGEGLTACFAAAAAAPMPLETGPLRRCSAACPCGGWRLRLLRPSLLLLASSAGSLGMMQREPVVVPKLGTGGERADTLLFFQGERFSPSPGALPCALKNMRSTMWPVRRFI